MSLPDISTLTTDELFALLRRYIRTCHCKSIVEGEPVAED